MRQATVDEVIDAMRQDAPDAGPGPTRFPGRPASLELALLGLIAEAPRISGYDLVKLFDLSMAHYWHAHPTQIYATLDRMEDFGIIRRRKVIQRKRPAKLIYTITPAGERILVEWMESAFEAPKLKHPPLLRCRFLGHLGADGARAALDEERIAWRRHLERYREIEKNYFAGGKAYRDVNTMFTWFTLKRGIDWMEENIRWCDWALAEIEKNRALFPGVSMKARMKPLIPYDDVRHGRMARKEELEGKREYARRVERDKERAKSREKTAAEVSAVASQKHSKAARPYPKVMDWK